MSIEQNKAVVGRWFTEFWARTSTRPSSTNSPRPTSASSTRCTHRCRGRDEVRAFATKFRAAFPDLAFGGTADLIAEGDYVVGQWIGGGTHTGDAFDDMPIGELPAGSGKSMRFTGTTVLKVVDGLITEEIGLDDGVTVLQQLGLISRPEDSRPAPPSLPHLKTIGAHHELGRRLLLRVRLHRSSQPLRRMRLHIR